MLRLQKVLQVKTHMRSILEGSRIRLLKEFGAENKALEHVSLLLFSKYFVFVLLSTEVDHQYLRIPPF